MVTIAEYQQRRKHLMQQMGHDSIAIICTNPEFTRIQDVHYTFRPDSNFYYLTGFAEPNAVAVLVPGDANEDFILFNRSRDTNKEIWQGVRAGQVGAIKDYGADRAFAIEDFPTIIMDLLKGKQKIFYQFGFINNMHVDIAAWQKALRQKVRSGISLASTHINVSDIINEMRVIKSAAEIDMLRQAANINSKAHRHAMQVCRPGMSEIQLSAELNYVYGQHHCLEMAYPPIVASGTNACTLHYLAGEKTLQDGELVLIDMGEEYQYYASDITRTLPVSGKFSAEQKAIYELVLHTQIVVLNSIKPAMPFDTLQQLAITTITEGLIALNLLQGNRDDLIASKAYRVFYPHNVSHWLGLDVHDVSTYKTNDSWRKLQPGMVLTVEPGIYIQPNNTHVDAKWRGIGVRIEDDVVVTHNGHENLTATIPKTVRDIEHFMNQ